MPRPSKAMLSALSKLGAKKGGKARQAAMTPEERKAHSALMTAKRWPKRKS